MAFVELGPVNPNSMAMLQLAAPGNTARASAGSSPHGPAAGGEPDPETVGARADRGYRAHAGDHNPPSTVLHISLPVGPRLKPRSSCSSARLIPAKVRAAVPWMKIGPITRSAASAP